MAVKNSKFKIPQGIYSTQFILGLSLVIYKELLNPNELEFLFEDGRTEKEMIVVFREKCEQWMDSV